MATAHRKVWPLARLAVAGAATACAQPGPEPQAAPPWLAEARQEMAAAPLVVRTRAFHGSTALEFIAGSAWERQTAADPNLLAHFVLPGAAEDEAADLHVYWFGPEGAGTVDANLRRWADSIAVAEGDPLLAAEITTSGGTGALLTRMRLSGRSAVEGPDRPRRGAEWALDAGLFESRVGPIYIHAAGPPATLLARRAELDAFYRSLRLEPAPGF